MFGRDFESYKEEADEDPVPAAPIQQGPKEDLTKFSAKKGKAAAKTVKAKYQWQILNSIGIPIEEIHLFADPQYWSVVPVALHSRGPGSDIVTGWNSFPRNARKI